MTPQGYQAASRLQKLSGGFRGLSGKIKSYREMVANSIFQHPEVRDLAERAAGRGPREAQLKNLFAVLRERVNYIPDPVGIEFTKAPWVMAREIETRGSTSGDCDDQAVFSAALLKSIGVPASFKVIWRGASPNPCHIYVLASFNGRIVPFDTTRREMGVEAESSRFEIYDV